METSFTGRDPSSGQSLKITCVDGHIASIEQHSVKETLWLAPGLIDLQVNGYHGDDFNADDLTTQGVIALVGKLLAAGVTALVPTLITASEEKLVRNLRVIAAARNANALVKYVIPCVHIEGPHIASDDGPRGAHPIEHVRPPDAAEFARWQQSCGQLVGMVTLSPHYAGAPAYIRALSAQSIHVAIGHTDASVEQIQAAVDAGASLSTHLGNGVAQMLPRHPNLLWAQLADDRLTATFIADGHHLPADTFTAMLRAKTLQRSILVSDLVMLAGCSPGTYKTPVGGSVELHPGGRLNVAGTNFLAGSTTLLKDAVAHVISATGCTLADALKMATVNPGRFAGRAGALRVGAPADLVRFQWQPGATTLGIEEVVIRGRSAADMAEFLPYAPTSLQRSNAAASS